jgi:hypothetical protein
MIPIGPETARSLPLLFSGSCDGGHEVLIIAYYGSRFLAGDVSANRGNRTGRDIAVNLTLSSLERYGFR